MRIIRLIVIAVLIIGMFLLPNIASSRPAQVSTVQMSILVSNTSKSISEYLVGFNLNIDTGESTIYNTQNWTNATFIQNTKDMHAKIIRFPGGEWADMLRWSRDTTLKYYDDPDGSGHLLGYITPKYIDDFINFTTAVGAEPLITVNVYDYNVSAAQDMINYTIEKEYNVTYWEIGNEVYTDAGEYPNYSLFEPVWVNYSNAMKSVKSDIELIGFDGWYDSYDYSAGENENLINYTNQFIFNHSANVSYIDMHAYPRFGYTLFDWYTQVYNGEFEDSSISDLLKWNSWQNKSFSYSIGNITNILLVFKDRSGIMPGASYDGVDYFYVDNITLYNSTTGSSLVIGDFETGIDGISNVGGDNTLSLESVSDVSMKGSKSLKVTYNFSNTDGLSYVYLNFYNKSFIDYNIVNWSVYVPSQTNNEKEFLAEHYKEMSAHLNASVNSINTYGSTNNSNLRIWIGEEDLVSYGDDPTVTNHGWVRSMIAPIYSSLVFSEYINYDVFAVQNWLVGYEGGAIQYHNGAMEIEKMKYAWEMIGGLDGMSLNVLQNSSQKVNLISTRSNDGQMKILATNYNASSNINLSLYISAYLRENFTVNLLNDSSNNIGLSNISIKNNFLNYTLNNYSIYMFKSKAYGYLNVPYNTTIINETFDNTSDVLNINISGNGNKKFYAVLKNNSYYYVYINSNYYNRFLASNNGDFNFIANINGITSIEINSIPHVSFDIEDINYDKNINTIDLDIIKDSINTDEPCPRCDVNKDGSINLYDLVLVSKKI
ncbi:Uncharacterised protein [uncultured archaeon]|nr:Uncharacterised protein [uncultured archaeon]